VADGAARSTRTVFRDLVAELLPADERLVCLDSDTGLFQGVDFGAASDRYLNVGIAEQTLVGVAAALAKEGRVPLVTTMAAFASARAMEAVKVDVALNGLPVRIAATHSGVSAGHLGPTHHALEDLAVMRAMPGMTVVVPGDAASAETLLRQSLDLPGPVYLRLGRDPTPGLPRPAGVTLGRVQVLRQGDDVALAACGPRPTLAALAAADRLEEDGVRAAVLHVHTVKPLDVPVLAAFAERRGGLVTVEEHWGAGGFGSAVTEALTALMPVRVLRVAMPDEFVRVAGTHEYLLDRAGVTAAAVAGRARDLVTGRGCTKGERR
jgi:transketolase